MAGPVWGTAEIRVTADGKILPTQIRRIADDAGDKAGTGFAKSFNKSLDREGKKGFGGSFKSFFKDLNKELHSNSEGWKGMSHNARQWTLIIGSIAAGLPGLTSLISAAGVGVLALGSAFASLAVGAGVGFAVFSRFTGDIEKLPADVKEARKAFDGLKDTFSELNTELTSRAFKDTTKAWQSLSKTVKGLEGPLGKVADVISGLVNDLAKNLAPGTKNFENLSKLIENSAGVFDSLVRSIGIFGGALLTAFTNPAMVKAVDGLVGWINDLATGFDNFVNSPAYSEWVTNGVSVFEHIGGLLESLGIALSGLFDKQTTDDLNDFIDGLGKFLEGPGKSLIDFLDELDVPGILIDALNNLGTALQPIVDFLTDFMDANPELVKGALEGLATALGALVLIKITTGIVTPLSGLVSLASGKNTSKINKFAAAFTGLGIAIGSIAADPNAENGSAATSAIGGALAGLQFGGPIGALVGTLAGLIASMITDVFLTPDVKGSWQNGWDQIFDPNNFDGAGIGEFKKWFQQNLMGPTEGIENSGGGWLDQVVTGWGETLETWKTETLPTWWEGVTTWWSDLSVPGGEGDNPWADTAEAWGKDLRKFFTETLPTWWEGITTWVEDLSIPGGEGDNPWADTAEAWGKDLNKFFTETLPTWWTNITTWFQGLFLPANNPWVANLSTWAASINTFFTVTLPTWWGNVTSWFGNLKLFGNPLSSLMSTWASSVWNFVNNTLPSWWQAIVNFFSGKSISSMVAGATRVGDPPGRASGGVLYGPTRILAGEDGPEAIVPLRRSLSRVDPSVRALSAIAQGMTPMASGGTVGTGRNVTIAPGAVTINGALDPQRTALTVVNRLAERIAG